MALYGVKKVCQRFDFSRSYLYKLLARGEFPAQVKMGRRSMWSDSVLDELEANWLARGKIIMSKPKLKVLKGGLSEETKQSFTREEGITLPPALQG